MLPLKPNSGLSPEVLAVVRSSPNLTPCRKLRRTNIFKFFEHLSEGKCGRCLAFFRQLGKEQRLMRFLRENRN
jgi:hypothetical protein